MAAAALGAAKLPDGVRMNEQAVDEDGIPMKYAKLLGSLGVQMSPKVILNERNCSVV
jgi:hypothetical protein